MRRDRDPSKMKLFTLNSNAPLAKEIADHIGLDLGKSSIKRFSDGEVQINIEETARGFDTYLIQSTSEPGNEYLMELLIMIDALKRASARTINVVMPYYGYARQDRKARSREPITAKLIANLLQSAGATRVISVDMHAPQVQGFFNIPVDQLKANALLSDYFIKKEFKDVVVIAPENAGTSRARALANNLDAPIAFLDKQRNSDPEAVHGINVIGEIEGKTAIIIDDMIDTARTVTSGSMALIKHGAKEVYACCTHGVLSEPAVERIRESDLKEVVITNSIYQTEERRDEKIISLSIGPLLAEGIMRVQNNESVSTLFE
ncbi:ribose-phosphate diphosphokinase [Salipaludibacillus aurantiacus]|uniref:Ribose-phosphate pyrophosphokinase n=1 Tax=Salipaludibacillus aurantiacus TaxID=1601833 RepID=A0A1H9XAB2_9BACI|nr:ribose-phosphate pyrophosphokinase [Salipaludibacillus aurantiacus]SES43075.1 ribose-phosphate pyrophosphokinase [Salipaludibacillus aurantiacus]